MRNDEQKFHHQIEVESIWIATEQAGYVFIAVLFIATFLVIGLWDSASQSLLFLWFSLLLLIHFIKWKILYFYHTHKGILVANINKVKFVLLFWSGLAGLCWTMCVIWFLVPSQPTNVMLITVALTIEVIGTMLIWFSYLPIVLVTMLPPALTLVGYLFLQGDRTYIATSMLLFLLTMFGVVSSLKLAKMLNYALYLNFENIALREKSDIARKEAEQANVAKTRFLAAASHDLRQPIHALNLFFAELSDRVRNVNTNVLITQIDESINAINSMLSALLDVSKLDAGVVKPDFRNINLTEIFGRLESEFASIAQENHNTLRIRHTYAVVHSDPIMLERILRNLISNALRYTENGRVLVAARTQGDYVRIQVFDTGPGIPANQLEEIFIEFHQLGNPARNRRQGLGLGLAIVKRLANLLEHEIKVSSTIGRGSCFSITLRFICTIKDTLNAELTRRHTNISLAGHSVLVLDDDVAVLSGMRGLLTHWGCRVITAISSSEAFRRIASDEVKPDLLIIDYRLVENQSGIEVAREIQNYLHNPLPVILLTGDTAPERLKEASASGFKLLHKPVELPELRSTLLELLSKDSRRNQ